jgi:hypothetical protein
MNINIFRLNTINVGDVESSPVDHFDFLADMLRLDIHGYTGEVSEHQRRVQWWDSVSNANIVVVGGGGLLESDYFDSALQLVFNLAKPSAKIVLWGAGHNKWDLKYWRGMKTWTNWNRFPFSLIGTRDDNQGQRWVPCVSCMSPQFDVLRQMAPVREFGLYVHEGAFRNNEISPDDFDGMPILANDVDYPAALHFLAECETVVTNSYHGVYWSTLLGRKVVALPTSSKFYDLKHPVPLCAPSDWKRHRRLAICYPEALDECRTANVAFAEAVKSLM